MAGTAGTTIELDYSDDRDRYDVRTPVHEARAILEQSVPRWLRENKLDADVTYEIVRVFGPAGGAAVIAFTAPTRERLHDVLSAYGFDAGEREEFLAS